MAQAKGPPEYHAGGISESLIRQLSPCEKKTKRTVKRLSRYSDILMCKKFSYLSMQIFSTWGTRTWSSRMIVCKGSLLFQDMTCTEERAEFTVGLVRRVLQRMATSLNQWKQIGYKIHNKNTQIHLSAFNMLLMYVCCMLMLLK